MPHTVHTFGSNLAYLGGQLLGLLRWPVIDWPTSVASAFGLLRWPVNDWPISVASVLAYFGGQFNCLAYYGGQPIWPTSVASERLAYFGGQRIGLLRWPAEWLSC